jgi:hypothetical protein
MIDPNYSHADELRDYTMAQRQTWGAANADLKTRQPAKGTENAQPLDRYQGRARSLLSSYQQNMNPAIEKVGDRQGVHTNWMKKGVQ